MRFATRAIHVGNEPDPATGAVMAPIYMTSTFELESPGHTIDGFDYTRANNPNFNKLEQVLASLEEASYATVFTSGIGALSSLASTLSQGDKVLTLNGIYGGTYRLFNYIFNKFGVEFLNVPVVTLDAVEQALKLKPKWMLFETPTNPLMNIFDIETLAKMAKKYGVLTVIDNTFASPYCQNPLKLGADIVWHSTTKYISGHSDVLGGAIISNSKELKKDMDFARKTLGTNPSPFDCWLIMRGVKTLQIRMEQHQKNAMTIAKYLEGHAKVRKVYYPGLPSHPAHNIAKKQMKHFNGMLSVDFNLSLESTSKMLSSFKYFTLAESLGGVESLVSQPATMTHSIVPKKEREQMGITDGLVRISVGIEDSQDLLEDLEHTLKNI